CPGCQAWNTLVEEVEKVDSRNQSTFGFGRNQTSVRAKPEKITKIATEKEPRVTTSMKEFNRVLGGGIVPGSLVLVGGDQGLGSRRYYFKSLQCLRIWTYLFFTCQVRNRLNKRNYVQIV